LSPAGKAWEFFRRNPKYTELWNQLTADLIEIDDNQILTPSELILTSVLGFEIQSYMDKWEIKWFLNPYFGPLNSVKDEVLLPFDVKPHIFKSSESRMIQKIQTDAIYNILETDRILVSINPRKSLKSQIEYISKNLNIKTTNEQKSPYRDPIKGNHYLRTLDAVKLNTPHSEIGTIIYSKNKDDFTETVFTQVRDDLDQAIKIADVTFKLWLL
jgi:hypothetical protein